MRNTIRLTSVTAILVGLAVAGCGTATQFDNQAASDAINPRRDTSKLARRLSAFQYHFTAVAGSDFRIT